MGGGGRRVIKTPITATVIYVQIMQHVHERLLGREREAQMKKKLLLRWLAQQPSGTSFNG